MRTAALLLVFLLVLCFTLAAALVPAFDLPARGRRPTDSAAAVLLGEGRRMFANHFFTKADVYMHSGYYPTIFDGARLHATTQLADHGGAESREGFLGEPRDWLDRFGRNFYISRHTHLGDGAAAGQKGPGLERELLPWLRLSASLDPQRVETYTVAAYWLRTHLGKVDEAESFLREGWRENPESCEILFELGRLTAEQRKDDARARNLFEAALRKWERHEAPTAEPDLTLKQRMLGNLARLEERAGRFDRAIAHLEALKRISPAAAMLEVQIEELRRKQKP